MHLTPESLLARFEANPRLEGLTLTFARAADARAYRARLYHLRWAARRRARLALDPEDPAWGRSPWDGLTLTLDTTRRALHIRRGAPTPGPRSRVPVPVEVNPRRSHT